MLITRVIFLVLALLSLAVGCAIFFPVLLDPIMRMRNYHEAEFRFRSLNITKIYGTFVDDVGCHVSNGETDCDLIGPEIRKFSVDTCLAGGPCPPPFTICTNVPGCCSSHKCTYNTLSCQRVYRSEAVIRPRIEYRISFYRYYFNEVIGQEVEIFSDQISLTTDLYQEMKKKTSETLYYRYDDPYNLIDVRSFSSDEITALVFSIIFFISFVVWSILLLIPRVVHSIEKDCFGGV